MGMATALNFQSAGENKVAATGDFVMAKEDVDHVTRALAGPRHLDHRVTQPPRPWFTGPLLPPFFGRTIAPTEWPEGFVPD
jgi:Domain of Unknown Function (DUF1259)